MSRAGSTVADRVVRRSERALGLSIRAGQERGEVARQYVTGGPKSDYARNGQTVRVDRSDDDTAMSPRQFVGTGHQAVEVYAMTDEVADDEFDEALDRAQAEENVSRANVVRKVREAVV